MTPAPKSPYQPLLSGTAWISAVYLPPTTTDRSLRSKHGTLPQPLPLQMRQAK